MKSNYQIKDSLLFILLAMIAFAAINWPMSQRATEATLKFPLLCAIFAFIAGIVGMLWLEKNPVNIAASTMAGFFCGFLIRITYDWTQDPTSHNLFPFEMILIAIYSFPPALLGAWLTSLLLRP